MDLSELERLENPAKVLRLSEAIRIGDQQIPSGFGWCHCAIGAAHFGLHGALMSGLPYTTGQVVEEWATEHGFDPKIARKAEQMYNITRSRGRVADWLESEGY